MTGVELPRRRRRAVGPAGARPAQDEPLVEPESRPTDVRRDRERYDAERPPHHQPR